MENKNRISSLRQSLEAIVEKWKSKSPEFSGKMKNSIKPILFFYERDMNKIGGAITTATYFDFIDQGVDGTIVKRGSQFSFKEKMPPISALTPWATSKGINPWALQRSLFNKGIEARNITEGIESDLLKLDDDFFEAFEEDVKETDGFSFLYESPTRNGYKIKIIKI